MKRLTVLRHAQAVQAEASSQDFDRCLTPRGQAQARESASRLVALGLVPDLIVVSTAQRTRETAALLQAGGLQATALRHDDRLYLASCATLLGLVRETGIAVSHLMLVSHNPGGSELCRLLCDVPEFEELATGAFCTVTLDIDLWTQTQAGSARRDYKGHR